MELEYIIDLGKYELSGFDLEKCMAGHLTVTGDGKIFTFGGFKRGSGHLPLIGWIGEEAVTFSATGCRCKLLNAKAEIYEHLFMAEKKKLKTKYNKWVILDKHIGFDSKEAAEAHVESFERSWKYPAHQIQQILFEIAE